MANDTFKHLNLEMPDEEELVIRAGSPRPAAEEPVEPGNDVLAPEPMPEQAPDTAPVHASEASDESTEAETAPRDDARMRELKRRAAELAAAEEGIQGPAKMPRMQIYVLGALALLVILLVVYTVFVPR